jgi:hypothetical protein
LGAALFAVVGTILFFHKEASTRRVAVEPDQPPKESFPQISTAAVQSGVGLISRPTQTPEQENRNNAVEPDKLVAGLRAALAGKDQAAINRYFEAIIDTGAACIGSLRVSLIDENNPDIAKTLAYALTRISTPESYAAAMEVSTLAGNKDTRYAVLDMVKATLNEEGNRYLIKLALSGTGDVEAATAGLIASAGDPDLLAGLVNSAASPGERLIAANVLGNSLSPGSAQVLQECTMLPDEDLAKAAVAGLAGQSSDESAMLLLNSFNAFGPAPNPERFQMIVDGLQTMLTQNPDKPGLAMMIESMATSGESNTTRAAAIEVLSKTPGMNPVDLSQVFEKALQFETDPQVKPFLEQGIRRISPVKPAGVPPGEH